VSRVWDNLYALLGAMGTTLERSELVVTPSGARHFSAPGSPFFRGAWATRFTDPDREIDETLAWFAARRARSLFWWHDDATAPADLRERLFARGFTEPEPGGSPAMDARIDDLAPLTMPPGVTVSAVTSDDDRVGFVHVARSTFEAPPEVTDAWVDASRSPGFPARLYLARLAGDPVATNILFSHDGVAGLYVTGTAPTAQGRGIGAAIVLAPLAEARARGDHAAVLFASPQGERLYARLGFAHTGERVRRYRWRAS